VSDPDERAIPEPSTGPGTVTALMKKPAGADTGLDTRGIGRSAVGGVVGTSGVHEAGE